ncbi:MAG: hypothetical protein EXR63_04290 [Dehalococcoidia bacterium]|nr:hypothetical protein [Dehalococcoidia bacterium]
MSARAPARSTAFVALLLGALALAPTTGAARADAQAQGVISGAVRNGTAGAPQTLDVRVQLIAIGARAELTSQEQQPMDGRFRFVVAADATVSYVLRTVYQGVPYLSEPPLLLSPEAPEATRDMVVYERAAEPPPLRITSTVVSVRGLDQAAGTLELQREDEVENTSDRAWAGRTDGITLRTPAPPGARTASDLSGLATVVLADGAVTTTQPLLPGRQVVVTRLAVAYDRAAAQYRLRVTAPLPTERIEAWVPARFLEDVTAEGDARAVATRTLEGERWRVVERARPTGPGEALVVTFAGLGGARATNPLTQPAGAALGAALAIAVVGGGAILAARLAARFGRPRTQRPRRAARGAR